MQDTTQINKNTLNLQQELKSENREVELLEAKLVRSQKK